MSTLTKRPISVHLRSDQQEPLRALAQRRGVSVAELIREGVDHLLADVSVEDDPIMDIIGLVTDGPSDLSRRHDDYLAKIIDRDNDRPS